ncbi:N-acylglucosamine-6-phosphate 2-epimerase [Pseudooceanicola antarcticus]|uniref:N-acylglucosamine-6-phosphate 2-epimerase n=1 Tax=Pseudooceanicola antarcticus TaxID=1247613 RepID=A0A285J1C9_9RHOB|nr:putative N-acetylmannosamine-6-phosphate 2-epimerase [Pseudooceanicola antarcticus]PJE29880.1 putative N-acetylmannosamine-6-phosphate 2-epimerase [Pseudooceanicola antarcticus]SNY54018.1 N-acylglucosamine-6-phosphate 2-epimerase [Pseudooceanicola antarcticus]
MTLIPKGCLVVSCQARVDNPLHGPQHMAAMAEAAEQAGAGALRANGPADIAEIRARTSLPVIGINKIFSDAPVYITPTREAAQAVLDAGAQIVGLDCTERAREGSDTWQQVLAHVLEAGAEVFADVSSVEEGRRAAEAGATYVASTLSGYTDPAAPPPEGPDYDLIEALVAAVPVPVIAEGRIATPEQAAEALARGAHAVVVGTMITNPRSITQGFVRALAPQQTGV